MLPNVLVTGFPDSGTSFLCNLVAELGRSAGPQWKLKQADEHNRWGYWEYRPIFRYIRWAINGPTRFTETEIPAEPLDFSQEAIRDIRLMAFLDGVEVYKDCAIPMVYRALNQHAKIIVIKRDFYEMFESPGLKHLGYYFTMTSLLRAAGRYDVLVAKMMKERDVLVVHYGNFRGSGFESQVSNICKFLDTPYKEGLHSLFRPRRS